MKIEFKQLSVQIGGKQIIEPFDLTIQPDEQWAFIGTTGSGKTLLAKAIAKQIFFHGKIDFINEEGSAIDPTIVLIEQHHLFKNKSNVSQFYYQQRFNSADAEETMTVEEDLKSISIDAKNTWIEKLHIKEILNKPIIQLSNGENKRLQIVKAFAQNPDLIILDNPFVGLDSEGRIALNEILNGLSAANKRFILITSPQTLPSCITKVGSIESGKIHIKNLNECAPWTASYNKIFILPNNIIEQFKKQQSVQCAFAVRMKNVSIVYNQKQILKNINWEIKPGERWSLSGHNGSGKSTLVSLITADNPQGFANEIYLFDKLKGTGESIWDIKKNIGFVSPELHLYFDKGFTAFETIASGLFDTIGLFKKLNTAQEDSILQWMDLLSITHLKNQYLHQLSLGQQRIIMLARAIVKAPPLLILDEPCQGLDSSQIEFFKQLIDAIASSTDTTMIYISHFIEDIPSCVNKKLHLENGVIDDQKSIL